MYKLGQNLKKKIEASRLKQMFECVRPIIQVKNRCNIQEKIPKV